MFNIGDRVLWHDTFTKKQDKEIYGIVNQAIDKKGYYIITWYNLDNTLIHKLYARQKTHERNVSLDKSQEEGKTKMKNVVINWTNNTKPLRFEDIQVQNTFVIDTPQSKGVVYMKVRGPERGHGGYMLELATGLLYHPTLSNIKLVDVDININAPRPQNY